MRSEKTERKEREREGGEREGGGGRGRERERDLDFDSIGMTFSGRGLVFQFVPADFLYKNIYYLHINNHATRNNIKHINKRS